MIVTLQMLLFKYIFFMHTYIPIFLLYYLIFDSYITIIKKLAVKFKSTYLNKEYFYAYKIRLSIKTIYC